LNKPVLDLVARMVEWCEPVRDGGCGHPRTETPRVLAALRRLLREGTPASGSTLRRRLADWSQAGVPTTIGVAVTQSRPRLRPAFRPKHPLKQGWNIEVCV